jgi:hypothetical protein
VSEDLCANRRIRNNGFFLCVLGTKVYFSMVNESEAVPQRPEDIPPDSERKVNGLYTFEKTLEGGVGVDKSPEKFNLSLLIKYDTRRLFLHSRN